MSARRRGLSVDIKSDVALETHADFLSSPAYSILRDQHVPANPMDQPSYSARHVSCEAIVFETWEQLRNDDHPTDWLVATVDKSRIIRLKGSGTNEGLDGILRCVDDDEIYFGAVRVTVRAGKRIKLLRLVVIGLNVTEEQKKTKMIFKNYIFNSFHGSHGEVLIPQGCDHIEYELTRHITALTGTEKWWIGTHVPIWYLPHPLDEDKHNPDDDFYENEQGTVLPKPIVPKDPTYVESLKNPADILRDQHWDWLDEKFDFDGTPLGSPLSTPGGVYKPSRYSLPNSRVQSEANSKEGSPRTPTISQQNSMEIAPSKSGRMSLLMEGDHMGSSSFLDNHDPMEDSKNDSKEETSSNNSSSDSALTNRKGGISAGNHLRTWPLDLSTRKLSIKEEGPSENKDDDDDDSSHNRDHDHSNIPSEIDNMTSPAPDNIFRASQKNNDLHTSQKGTNELLEGK